MVSMMFSLLLLILGATQMSSVESTDIVPYFRQRSVVQQGHHLHFVDPWIRPPRNDTLQEAPAKPGNFNGYPKIVASRMERITFIMRGLSRPQRHGVYINMNQTLVTDFLNNVTSHPCGPAVFTTDKLCKALSNSSGLNTTDCPNRLTLFPLVEMFGSPGTLEYTTPELGPLADLYGIPTGKNSRTLIFDCPHIQGRNEAPLVPGTTSHCIGGMYVVVEVRGKRKMGEGA